MQNLLLWFLSFILAMLSLIVAQPVRSQTSVPPSQNPNRPSSSGIGLDPFVILNLINSLSRSSNSTGRD